LGEVTSAVRDASFLLVPRPATPCNTPRLRRALCCGGPMEYAAARDALVSELHPPTPPNDGLLGFFALFLHHSPPGAAVPRASWHNKRFCAIVWWLLHRNRFTKAETVCHSIRKLSRTRHSTWSARIPQSGTPKDLLFRLVSIRPGLQLVL